MRIQYVSDLHLEFPDNTRWIAEHPLEVCGEVLLVAGDSGYVNMPDYAHHPFWRWASEHYKQVIIALGNHEFYQFADLVKFPDKRVILLNFEKFCSYFFGCAKNPSSLCSRKMKP